jgi:hypothetical protein
MTTSVTGWTEQRMGFRVSLVAGLAAGVIVASGAAPAFAAVWHGVPQNKVTQWGDGHGCTFQAAYGVFYGASYAKARVSAVAPHARCRVNATIVGPTDSYGYRTVGVCLGVWTAAPTDWCQATGDPQIAYAQFTTFARTPKGHFSVNQFWYPS